MKANNLSKLEKDNSFKKKNLSQYFWLKQPAIYPPASLIFVALAGLIYLLNSDKLVSYYAIPFVIMLLLGAIWLKATRKLILQMIFDNNESFLICRASVVKEKGDFCVAVFSTSKRRHDKYFTENIKKQISEDKLDNILNSRSRKAVLWESGTEETVFLKKFSRKAIHSHNAKWQEESTFPVIFININNIKVLKRKYMLF